MTPDKRLEIQDHGNTVLRCMPRHAKPMSDDVVLAVTHRTYDQGRSTLLTRAKATELRDWLDLWLDEGWDGIPQQDGETTSDLVRHYEDVAIRARIEADRVRAEANRQIDAALALIPPDRRTVDLQRVVDEQTRVWNLLTGEHQAREKAMTGIVSALIEMWQAAGATADQLRKAARVTLDRYNHPKPVKQPSGDAPIYRMEQLSLFDAKTVEEAA